MLRPQFACFGDSLTQQAFDVNGWGTLLSYQYVRKVDVLNRGYSGYNSRWAVQILPKVFPQDQREPYQLVTVFFGANDAAPASGQYSKQHVPLIEYKDNLRFIHEHLSKCGVENIMFITPSPVDDVVLEGERVNQTTQQYATGCMEVAKSLNIPVLDLWTRLQTIPDWQNKLLSDGVHFNQEGNFVTFQVLKQFIDDTFQSLSADRLLQDVPLWREVDAENCVEYFQEVNLIRNGLQNGVENTIQ
eukprot:TRINITY_DN60848_c0_g1_i1.p2 TRINITY_DN60848_c0_g1~~TRINITY_DN60848_c0_g1_i1.p2  ORF type:complete len:286 (+),score=27.51 TRINITY_DN60848_c0_g1_i1:126-860(+)